ncbi:MAG: hypothetical protein DI535_02395 [Citrobacter freundii]|nr:MAG: hypothetical protein DI535_02395 [Citrobacter freundii]
MIKVTAFSGQKMCKVLLYWEVLRNYKAGSYKNFLILVTGATLFNCKRIMIRTVVSSVMHY